MDAQCPYCQATLPKAPTRKTKCKSCGQFMYVKRAPGETDRRIVTEAERDQVEQQWEAHHDDWKIQRDIQNWKLDQIQYRRALQQHGGSRAAALNALLADKADAGDRTAVIALCLHGEPVSEESMARRRQLARMDIEHTRKLASRGSIAGYRVKKPPPSREVTFVQRMHAEGHSPERIAAMTDRSVLTVRNMIGRSLEDKRCGPHCDLLTQRLFTFDEALAELPVPCGPDCACQLQPVFHWEVPKPPRAASASPSAQQAGPPVPPTPDEPVATPTPISPEPGPVARFWQWLSGTSRT